jgi:hypothetical protein
VLDVTDALLALLEPAPSTVVKDDTAERPFEWVANTLYAYPVTDVHVDPETGAVPTVRENFTVEMVFVADHAGEEAKRERDRDVSVLLDAKAHAYADILARNSTRGAGRPWDYARVASVDWDRLRQIDVRGVAVRITGWRYVEVA